MAFPILLPIAGWLVGKAIDAWLNDGDLSWNSNIQQYRVGRSGHGMVVSTRFQGSMAKTLESGSLILRPVNQSGYIKSNHDGFKDRDGDIYSGGLISLDGDDAIASVYIPFCAFPNHGIHIAVEIIAVRADGHSYPAQRTDAFKLMATELERHTAIAAICDGAIGAIRQTAEVRREHVRAAKEAITEAWSLDGYGRKELQQHLRRANATTLNSEWYHPQRIAADIADELTGSDRLVALRMLYAIAGATGSVSDQADKLFGKIAEELALALEEIEEIRNVWRADAPSALYAVLDLVPGATIGEIRSAFRRIAKTCHPDTVRHLEPDARSSAAEKFRAAKHAYDTLLRAAAS